MCVGVLALYNIILYTHRCMYGVHAYIRMCVVACMYILTGVLLRLLAGMGLQFVIFIDWNSDNK